MRSVDVLELINAGEIYKLKCLLAEEIYQDSLKKSSNAKKRYAAMKRFFKYANKFDQRCCRYPCLNIKILDKTYNSFLDGYCFALTAESIGTLEPFDESAGDYFNMEYLLRSVHSVSQEQIDLNIALAAAKAKGYKYKKEELGKNFQYVFQYKENYYKMGLLDKAFSIVDDNEPATVSYLGTRNMLMIETSIGICGVMPVILAEGDAKTKVIITHGGEVV